MRSNVRGSDKKGAISVFDSQTGAVISENKPETEEQILV